MIRSARATALALGIAVLGWQAWNAWNGRFVHRFLVSDLAASFVLLAAGSWPGERGAAAGMLAGFAALAGVFLSATAGGLLVDGYQRTGTVLTTFGLVPCVLGTIGLALWLAENPRSP